MTFPAVWLPVIALLAPSPQTPSPTTPTATPSPSVTATPFVHETPPPPLPPRRTNLPTPTEKRLGNGLRVVVVPKRGTGLLSVVLVVKGAGGASDPPDKAGLADFAATLVTKGTPTRTATETARAIETLGGSLDAGAGWDDATLSLSVLAANADPALALFADAARHPAFLPAEAVRLRRQTLDDLQVSLQEPGTLARYAVNRAVFGDSPYAHPLGGTPESVSRLQIADARAFHAAHWNPAVSVLVFGGDITPTDAFSLAEKQFGDWKPAATAKPINAAMPPKALKPPPLAGKIVVIDKPDAAGQAAVFVSRPALSRASSDYYAAVVANDILGGGFSSRLNHEIRIKRGLAYGAGSSIAARLSTGPFTARAQTKTASAGEVAALLEAEIRRMATVPPTAGELAIRKAALVGGYDRSLESGGGLAGETASLVALGLAPGELAAYPPHIARISAADVRRAAAAYLSPTGATIVVVGDAQHFLPDLRKRFAGGPPVVVIPVSRLDLNRADLTRPTVR